MRSIVSAAFAALTMLLAAPSPGVAQDAVASADAATAGLPKRPVPYTKLHPKRAAPKARPASPRPPSPRPASAAAVPGSTAPTAAPPAQPAAPRQAIALASAAAAPPATAPAPAKVGARLAPGQLLPPAELEAFVDGLVQEAMSRDHIAGVTVSVVQNGQVVLKKGYGFASLNPRRAVDPDRTLFRIGSISKTFTWIALMKEVEAGRIRLGQPINLYLPEKLQVRDQGYDQPVRVINLMDHSAGFEDRALGQLFERNFERVRPLELYLRQERPKRVRAPGAVASYSNYGAALAGEAASYASGKPFETLIEDDILAPLGMAHTTFREPRPAKRGLPAPMPEALAPGVSEAWRWTPTGFQRRDYEYIGQIAPAGAASSTAGDMARYMLMQLGGGQLDGVVVYGPRTAQAFRTPLRRTPTGVNGWAHGFIVYDLPGGFAGYGHDGATLSFFSSMVLAPQLNLGMFVSTNTETGSILARQLPAAVVRQFYASPQAFPRPGSPELVRNADAFEGYYVSTRRPYSGLEGFVMRLRSGAGLGVTPQGRLVLTGGNAVSSLVPEGPVSDGRFIGAQDQSRLAFTMQDGRARSFVGSSGAALFERAAIWQRPSNLAALAALAAGAALATLGGVLLRNRRDFRENQVQSRASLLQNIQAGLWLAALVLFGLWASKTGDVAQVMYRWPGALLVTASACALVAAALTITTAVALPAVWRGGRRVDSWSHLRKAFFTLTVAIYAAFSVVLAMWGALSPWSG